LGIWRDCLGSNAESDAVSDLAGSDRFGGRGRRRDVWELFTNPIQTALFLTAISRRDFNVRAPYIIALDEAVKVHLVLPEPHAIILA